MSLLTSNNDSSNSQAINGTSSSVGGWLRNSVARSSFGRKSSSYAPSGISSSNSGGWLAAGWLGTDLDKVDPHAAFYTFRKHWQQMCEIMERTRQRKQVFQDDVTAVINHLGQMMTLLQVDIREMTRPSHNLVKLSIHFNF